MPNKMNAHETSTLVRPSYHFRMLKNVCCSTFLHCKDVITDFLIIHSWLSFKSLCHTHVLEIVQYLKWDVALYVSLSWR